MIFLLIIIVLSSYICIRIIHCLSYDTNTSWLLFGIELKIIFLTRKTAYLRCFGGKVERKYFILTWEGKGGNGGGMGFCLLL